MVEGQSYRLHKPGKLWSCHPTLTIYRVLITYNDVRIIWFQINKVGFMSENAKWMLHEFNYKHCNLNVSASPSPLAPWNWSVLLYPNFCCYFLYAVVSFPGYLYTSCFSPRNQCCLPLLSWRTSDMVGQMPRILRY